MRLGGGMNQDDRSWLVGILAYFRDMHVLYRSINMRWKIAKDTGTYLSYTLNYTISYPLGWYFLFSQQFYSLCLFILISEKKNPTSEVSGSARFLSRLLDISRMGSGYQDRARLGMVMDTKLVVMEYFIGSFYCSYIINNVVARLFFDKMTVAVVAAYTLFFIRMVIFLP